MNGDHPVENGATDETERVVLEKTPPANSETVIVITKDPELRPPPRMMQPRLGYPRSSCCG